MVQGSACLLCGFSLAHIVQLLFACWISCSCFGWLHKLNLRPAVKVSVTFAVLATLLNQRAGRKALISETFFRSYKSPRLANRGFSELLLLVGVGLLDLMWA